MTEASRPIDCARGQIRGIRGMTLLEVLAAFLIFSMVFTVLVGSSQSGVRSQGLSVRRLEANAVAERVMIDIEVELKARAMPPIPENEIEEGDFKIRVAESALAEDSAPLPGALPDETPPAPSFGDSSDALALLASQLPDMAKYLRRFDVEVEWVEGAQTQTLQRTTMAFDWQGAAAEFPDLFANGAPGAASTLAANGGEGPDGEAGTEESGQRADDPNSSSGRGNSDGVDPELCRAMNDACAKGLVNGLFPCPFC